MSRVCAIKTKEIQNGSYLMNGNTSLHTWNSDLDKLEIGDYMFTGCSNLTSFTAATPMLRYGSKMFNLQSKTNKKTTRVKMDFDELRDGYYMFADCYNLHLLSTKPISSSFNFPKLTNGYAMFANTNHVTVYGQNGGQQSDIGEDFGYMTFPELIDATEMFKNNKDVTGVYEYFAFPKVRRCNEAFAYSYISTFENNQLYRDCTGLPAILGMDSQRSEFKYMFKDSKLTNFYMAVSSSLPSASYFFDCEGMFYNCKNLTTVRWDQSFGEHVRHSLYLFKGCDALTTIECDLPYMSSAVGFGLENNSKLTTYTGSLGGLKSGEYMFRNCQSLTSFTSDLRQFENGHYMFDGCENLENFNVSNLGGGIWGESWGHFEYAYGMFRGCQSLKNFGENGEVFGGYEFPYLSFAQRMFEGCHSLKAVNCMFPALEEADYMFYDCISLTSFNGNLPKLLQGTAMFQNCRLDYTSFRNIINSLPTYSGGTHEIHITVQNSSDIVEGFSTDSIFAGQTTVIIPKVNISTYEISYKGWKIFLSADEQFTFDGKTIPTNERDIVVGSEFVPNASGWYTKHGSTDDIVKVVSGYAYDSL